MYTIIEKKKSLKIILLNQVRIWWGDNITNDQIELIINIFKDYLKNDPESTQLIRVVKELFNKNINDSDELSKIIDEYLIPQDLEKKNNAEISTPYDLRKETLNTLPINFWKSTHKVLEPCSGKGGFLLDIVSRFMDGLKDKIPDKNKRYKKIVEKCLYWCDINPTNIFICKLLLDPFNKYKLNYSEGNTLELDIKVNTNTWRKLNEFDAIIGNPPYNRGKNSNFYRQFIDFAYDNLKQNGYILYIIPNRFLIPKHEANTSIKKFNGILIKHTVNNFNVSTDIGYYLGIKSLIIDNTIIKCIFKDNIEYNINLDQPTPSANNSLNYKLLSDKILLNKQKLLFIKNNKDLMEKDKYIFIPRHWTRYSENKPRGGSHIFNILNDYSDDGRFIEINKITKNNIIWYLSRSKIIRFITKNYASTVFIPPFIWENIPLIDFTIKHDDNSLYELFQLSSDEINLINDSLN